jgi:ribosomal protein S18 acetylase RimI-like enzyme
MHACLPTSPVADSTNFETRDKPNSMEVRLEISEENDLEQVVSFVRAYHAFEGIEDTDDISATIQPLLGNSQYGRVWLIYAGSQPVGYIAVCFGYSIEFAGPDAFIDEMFIVPEQRAKGIGRSALRLLKPQAAVLGLKALHLEVARTNERAQRLYASTGFRSRERFFLMSSDTSGEIRHDHGTSTTARSTQESDE